MNITNENINDFLNKYISDVDSLSTKYNYPSNIKHVLYLIVPAFIIKYGLKEERKILKCFDEVPVYISGIEDKRFTAYFNRSLHLKEENGINKYFSTKQIVINNYDNIGLVELIDNLVHEFNHAVNSIENEIRWDDKQVSLRTGLSHINFDKFDIDKVNSRSKDIVLEEIINTKQTEDIINIINSFNNYSITNQEFVNTLYSLKHDIKGSEYKSDAYYFQSYICKELMKNKTFIPTIENLRLNGNVDDIESWFDNITGVNNSYKKLVALLDEILREDANLSKVKFFKKYRINKILGKSREVLNIISIFEKNCIYK